MKFYCFSDGDKVSTAENICVYIFDGIKGLLPSNVQLHKIKLYETDKNIATYKGEYLVQ